MNGQVISHYRVVERIGGGGMGVVFRARDLELDRDVAIKFLPPEVGGKPGAMEQLRKEARAAAALNHPNICAIHEIGTHEGEPFIVMELVIGDTLDGLIRTESSGGGGGAGDLPPELAMAVNDYVSRSGSIRQPLPPATVIALGIQVADALDAAHREGVIHRDITPSNIVVTPEGQAKIVDFGLARVSRSFSRREKTPDGNEDSDGNDGNDGDWGITGTITHMSPEQAQGLDLDPRTDLFSLGTVLYEISTGRRAFRGSTEEEILDAIVRQDPTPPGEINPALPSDLERIIMKCLEKETESRYRTARELVEALERVSPPGQR